MPIDVGRAQVAGQLAEELQVGLRRGEHGARRRSRPPAGRRGSPLRGSWHRRPPFSSSLRKIASSSSSSAWEKPCVRARRSSCSPAARASRQVSGVAVSWTSAIRAAGARSNAPAAARENGAPGRSPRLSRRRLSMAPASSSRRPVALRDQAVGTVVVGQDDVQRDARRQGRVADQHGVQRARRRHGMGRDRPAPPRLA